MEAGTSGDFEARNLEGGLGVLDGPLVLATLKDASLLRAAPLPSLNHVLTAKPEASTTAPDWRMLYSSNAKPSGTGMASGTPKWLQHAASVTQLLIATGIIHAPPEGTAASNQVHEMAQRCARASPPLLSPPHVDQLREALHRARVPQPSVGLLAQGSTAHAHGDSTAPPVRIAMSAAASIRRLQSAVMPRGGRRSSQPQGAGDTPNSTADLGLHGVPVLAGWVQPRPAALVSQHSQGNTQRRAPMQCDLSWIAQASPIHEEMRRVQVHETAASAVARLRDAHPDTSMRLTAGIGSWGVPMAALAGTAQSQLGKRPPKRRLAAGRSQLLGRRDHEVVMPQAAVTVGADLSDSGPHTFTPPQLAKGGGKATAIAAKLLPSDLQRVNLPSAAASQLQDLASCLPPSMAAAVSSSGLEAAEVAFLGARARVANTSLRLQLDTLSAAGVCAVALPLHEWRSISTARRAAYLRMLLP